MELTGLNLAAIAAAVSAIAAACGLFVNAWSLKQAKRTRELQIFDRIFGSIIHLEEKLHDAAASGAGPAVALAWRGTFLNTLEYFAFLVNREYLSDPRLAGFFSDAVEHWYKDVFLKEATRNEQTDPKIYPELKALYGKITRYKFDLPEKN